MSKLIKAKVLRGRYKDEIVRVSNVSVDELGRRSAACTLSTNQRANILVSDLEVIPEVVEPEIQRPKVSMPFVSGAASSRTLTQTKNMAKLRPDTKPAQKSKTQDIVSCETCHQEYDREERKGRPGKITQCENCAVETETKVEGAMIFSHKTGATIEIKKDGELRHEADTFDPKNKT